MLIQSLNKLHIVSPFGERIREGKKEFHPGVDIRVFNKAVDSNAQIIFPIIAPEAMRITVVNFSNKWGHEIRAVPLEENELGIIEFRFWHVKPDFGCVVNAEFDPDVVLGVPEDGYVPLHLHWETRIDYRGTTPIDPMRYFELRGQEVE